MRRIGLGRCGRGPERRAIGCVEQLAVTVPAACRWRPAYRSTKDREGGNTAQKLPPGTEHAAHLRRSSLGPLHAGDCALRRVASSRYSASGLVPVALAMVVQVPRGGRSSPCHASQASSRSRTVRSERRTLSELRRGALPVPHSGVPGRAPRLTGRRRSRGGGVPSGLGQASGGRWHVEEPARRVLHASFPDSW